MFNQDVLRMFIDLVGAVMFMDLSEDSEGCDGLFISFSVVP